MIKISNNLFWDIPLITVHLLSQVPKGVFKEVVEKKGYFTLLGYLDR